MKKPVNHIVKIVAILVLGILIFACHRSSPTSADPTIVFSVGKLQVTFPSNWRWLDAANLKPIEGDPDCDCGNRLAVDPMPLARIATGRDTLVLDTMHMVLWPGTCYEGCFYEYDNLLHEALVDSFVHRNEKRRAAAKKRHRVDLVLPSVLQKELGGIQLYAMNGQYVVEERWGIYYSGNSSQRPLNIYGKHLEKETMEELYDVWMSAVWIGD